MKKIFVANWKMNPRTEGEAVRLAHAGDFPGSIIAPPFPFLENVGAVLKHASLGAQDVFFENPIPGGAYTGEVSLEMLKKLGVSHIIIGHSERRAMGETDEIINKKIKAALKEKMKVIFCVGENRTVRRRGQKAVAAFLNGQLTRGVQGVMGRKNIIVAYEPLWAIGSGKSDRPEDTADMARFIRARMKTPVLYGGSVTAKNISGFLTHGNVDGVLVGGASLRPREMKVIAVQFKRLR